MNAIQQFGLVVVGQVTAVSIVAVLLMLLSRRNAARRHVVGLLGLVLVLSSPLMTWVLPQTAWWRWSSSAESVAELPRRQSDEVAPSQWQPVFTPRDTRVTDADVLVESEPTPVVAMSPASTTVNDSSSSAADSINVRRVSWPSLLGVVWLAGAIVLASYWAWQHWRLRSLVRSLSLGEEADSREIESLAGEVCGALRLRGLPPIAVSEVIPMPMVLGLWRPVVVLPRELLQVGASARLREVLIHECAHVARRDPWVNVAQRLAAVLWWWHPGVLWLNRLIARSREEVCDNFVLRHGDATSYAQTLLELTERCSSRGRFVPALGLLGSRWTLEERITGLLKPGRDTMTQAKRRTVVLTAALLGALCLLVGGVRAVDEPQTKSETKQPAVAAEVVSDAEEKPAASRLDDAPPEVKDAKPPKAEDQFEFRFQIVNSKGEPVAGAKVTPWGILHSWFSSMLETKWCPETVTDAEGMARVVIAKEFFRTQAIRLGKEGLPTIQQIALSVDHPQHPVWSRYVSVGDPARVVLVDAATVEVLPRRKNDDELVRDVIPILSHYSASRTDWLAMKEQSQKEGVLTIRRIDLTSENATRWLRLVHVPKEGPAWFSELIDLKSLEAPISVKARLRLGTRVAGRLPDVVPRPVTNGRVVAQIVSGGSSVWNNWHWQMETVIAEDGTFVLESVPAHENLQMIALCDGWVSRSPTLEEVTAYAKEHDFATKYHGGSVGIVYPQLFRTLVPGIEPVVPMEPTADCEVTVVNENGQPIADAEVSFWPNQMWFHSGSNLLGSGIDSLKAMQTLFQTGEAPKPQSEDKRFTAKTNARGMATIKNLTTNVGPLDPTAHDFYVRHDKFEVAKRPDENGGRFKTAQTVELFPRQTGRVTVRMTAIKKTEVKEAVRAEPKTSSAESAKSDRRKVVIRGTCQSEEGKPVANARVRVFRITKDVGEALALITETKGDSEGKFELRDIETEIPERWDLVVIATADKHVPFVTGPHKHDNGVIELAGVMSSNPGTMSGVVTDSRGQPIKGVTVFLPAGGNHPYPGIWSAVTDEKGRYAITDMKRWTPESTKTFDPKAQSGEMVSASYFSLKHPDFALTRAKNTAVPQEVNVTLYPPAIIEGQVVDAVTNRPAANLVVSAQGVARHGWSRTLTDGEGRYRLTLTKDHYNIWAESADRISIAVKALKAEEGKTVANADIRLVRGGFVVGRVIGADDKPVSTITRGTADVVVGQSGTVEPARSLPLFVGHYGPARPRTGAAVGSAKVNPDGTYRLRVAPGENYVYLMSGGGNSATVTVKEGEDITLDFRLGEEPKTGFVERTADEKLAEKLRRQAEEEDAAQANGGNRTATAKPVARQRAATPVGKLLDELEEQNVGNERLHDPWCRTLKAIVDLGPAAVPELIEELDATEKDMMLRCLGFTLRAINDKRAVPALIRAIPKSLLPAGSDYGCRGDDVNLVEFMQKHDLDDRSEKGRYSFGRPVREVYGALHKLTGQKFDEEQLFHVFGEGFASQQRAKRELFWRSAKKWSDWWEQHWSEHIKDAAYSQVKLPDLVVEAVKPPNLGTHFKTGGGGGNWLLESVLDPKANRIFLDFDTGRVTGLPEKWRNAKNLDAQLDDITAWAAREGFDLFGTEYVSPSDGKRYFALRPIGLRAWELGKDRWKMQSADITLESLQAEGTAADGLLLHYDRKAESFDPKETATFLFITREGTPGVLFVGVEVQDNSQKPGGRSMEDNELNPVHFFKGRRFGWTSFEEVGAQKQR